MKKSWKYFVLMAILLIAQGCAVYRPKPIDEQAVSRTLSSPDEKSICIKARQINHPILKPRNIDFKNGISAQDAAIIAVIANPALREERDRIGVANAQLLQAGILPNPTFGYSSDFPIGGNTAGTVTAYGLGLDWDIRSLLTRGAKVDAARAEAASVNLRTAWDEWQVAESAKRHVYRLSYLEKQLAVGREEEAGLRKNLVAVKKAVGMGDMTAVDLSAVDATLRKIHTSVLDIEKKQEQERLTLNQILGFPPGSVIPLAKGTGRTSFNDVPSLAEIMKGIERRRLDLLALKMGYKSREASLRAAIRAQFPKINIGFSHARDNTDVISAGFSVSISLPFFDRNQGRIAIEKAGRRQLFDEYLNRVYKTRADAAAILTNIKSVEKQVDAADKASKSLQRLVHISYRGFLEGNIDVLSYYDEVNRLFSRKLETLKLKQELADLHVALEITSGEFLGRE